jgi:lipopolysaccharide/colanic/teichoic acid biosynthesis glycosyltransferase
MLSLYSSSVLKRIFDILFSLLVLVVFFPLICTFVLLVFLQDFGFPFYVANRIGQNGKKFPMIKIRSMVINAESKGAISTSTDDGRVTFIGKFVRKFKIDELSQFINVLIGHMSVVGPRPNTYLWGVDLYTNLEMRLLDVKPGITDMSSIVFSDESEIVKGSKNSDLTYNQLIRPWKSRLGILYIQKSSILLDIKICMITLIAIFSKSIALKEINKILKKLNADIDLIEVAKRKDVLLPFPPPGSETVENGEKYLKN